MCEVFAGRCVLLVSSRMFIMCCAARAARMRTMCCAARVVWYATLRVRYAARICVLRACARAYALCAVLRVLCYTPCGVCAVLSAYALHVLCGARMRCAARLGAWGCISDS